MLKRILCGLCLVTFIVACSDKTKERMSGTVLKATDPEWYCTINMNKELMKYNKLAIEQNDHEVVGTKSENYDRAINFFNQAYEFANDIEYKQCPDEIRMKFLAYKTGLKNISENFDKMKRYGFLSGITKEDMRRQLDKVDTEFDELIKLLTEYNDKKKNKK